MKKQRLLKKVLRIICLQKGITYSDIAESIGVSKAKLLHSANKEFDLLHKTICEYARNNLREFISPKISCVLNDISFVDYCKQNDIDYLDFIYGG